MGPNPIQWVFFFFKVVHTNTKDAHTEERPGKDILAEKRGSSANRGERLQKKPDLCNELLRLYCVGSGVCSYMFSLGSGWRVGMDE